MTSPIEKIAANFVETSIDDEMVVMDIRSGNFFSLSGTGLDIWNLIDGTRDRAAVLTSLREAFPDVSELEIAGDLDDFLQDLSESELVRL